MAPVLEAKNIVRDYHVGGTLFGGGRTVHAVRGVSFTLEKGKTLAIVGESGSGKSTLARILTLIDRQTDGELRMDGETIDIGKTGVTKALRRKVQMVFQDPYGSLDPRQRAEDIVAEPLLVHGMRSRAARRERVAELFDRVGLRSDQMGNVPSKFSGGQRQRLAIARALALSPALIVADEPVSALDVSIQAQVINLMSDIQKELGLSYLFVSHDLGIVQHISDRVAVMYLGRVVEIGSTRALFSSPGHPYTRTLLDALPRPDPARRLTKQRIPRGEIPSPLNPPAGCAFHPRCPLASDICRRELPQLRPLASGTQAACHHAA